MSWRSTRGETSRDRLTGAYAGDSRIDRSTGATEVVAACACAHRCTWPSGGSWVGETRITRRPAPVVGSQETTELSTTTRVSQGRRPAPGAAALKAQGSSGRSNSRCASTVSSAVSAPGAGWRRTTWAASSPRTSPGPYSTRVIPALPVAPLLSASGTSTWVVARTCPAAGGPATAPSPPTAYDAKSIASSATLLST